MNKGLESPLAFAVYVLKVELSTAAMNALIYLHNSGDTMLRGGRGAGKTFILAIYLLWWHCRYGKVISLIPTERSTRTVLRSEVYMLAEQAGLHIDDSPTRYYKEIPYNRRPRNGVISLRGYNADDVLILIDECQTMPEELLCTLVGVKAGSRNIKLLASYCSEYIASYWLREYEVK